MRKYTSSEILVFLPFWISGKHKQEDIREKGDCYFNDIVELQQVRPAPLNIESAKY
jgi:hypothetical protein